MSERFEKHISVSSPGKTAIELLADNTELSRQRLKAAMSNGAVWLESQHGIKRLRRAKKAPDPGNILHIYYDSEIQAQKPQPASLIADEHGYSIWNKPAGMYSQGSKWGDHCSIYRWSEQHLQPQRRAYLVHRLDRAASGLIIIAHNKKTATEFMELFSLRRITKHYHASVQGRLDSLELPCVLDTPLDGKPAESILLQAEYDAITDTSTLLIDIKTGRKHQIRRHLSIAGYPLVGDRLYGDGDTRTDLQLCAVYLGFTCPLDNTRHNYSLS